MKNKISVSSAIFLIILAAFSAFALTYLYLGNTWVPASEQSKLDEALEIISQYYVGEYDASELEDAAVTAMVDSLGDRWSMYLTADEVKQYYLTSNNQYSGIGMVVEQYGDELKINRVYENSPAAEAGVTAGGIVISIAGESVSGKSPTEAKGMVSAAAETGSVELEAEYDGELRSFTIIPGVIEIDPVSFEMLESGIGLIKVDNFDAKSGEQIINACRELIAENAKGLVFDLRFNPGGQLDELIKALDYLLPEGDLFLSQYKNGPIEKKTSDESCLEMPMAVLVNEDSYSAAEFFAAALQEYNWAVIVGAHTTGKGYAQVTLQLSDGSAIHISTIKYYTPSGVSLAGVGIAPDIEVPLSEEKLAYLYYGMLEKNEDDQLLAAEAAVLDTINGK